MTDSLDRELDLFDVQALVLLQMLICVPSIDADHATLAMVAIIAEARAKVASLRQGRPEADMA